MFSTTDGFGLRGSLEAHVSSVIVGCSDASAIAEADPLTRRALAAIADHIPRWYLEIFIRHVAFTRIW